MLEHEEDSVVIDSVIAALGHLDNIEAVTTIARYENHPNKDVRFSVACAFGSYPNDPIASNALLRLTSDSDSDVRAWAVFGLGVQGDVDSPEVRDALVRCLSDDNEDVREEAAMGLAKRHDLRVLPVLRKMLSASELNIRPAEAADALLRLDESPAGWSGEDYQAALTSKFGSMA